MGKSHSADRSAGRAAKAQAELAQQLIGETDPLRTNLIGDAESFVSGDRDVTGLPEYAAMKAAEESQYERARDAIIGSTPEGGALTAALADLEGDRARALTQNTGVLSSDEINRALQLATFGAAQGSQGLGVAGQIQANRATSEAQQNAAKAEGTGQALGAWAGTK